MLSYLLSYYFWWPGHGIISEFKVSFLLAYIYCLEANGRHPFTHPIPINRPHLCLPTASFRSQFVWMESSLGWGQWVYSFARSTEITFKMAPCGPFNANPRASVGISWRDVCSLLLNLKQGGIQLEQLHPCYHCVQHENETDTGRKAKPSRQTEKLSPEDIIGPMKTSVSDVQNYGIVCHYVTWITFIHVNQQNFLLLLKLVWVSFCLHHNPESKLNRFPLKQLSEKQCLPTALLTYECVFELWASLWRWYSNS